MSKAVCHCGNVEIQLSRQPVEVFECSCSICSKLGVLWAYYSLDEVTLSTGRTKTYIWNNRRIEFHSCPACGCTTHWRPTDPHERRKMGVNARLIDGLNRSNVELHHVDAGENNLFWTREPYAQT